MMDNDDTDYRGDENIDKASFVRNQIISLNMRLSKKRFGGNTSANKCGSNLDNSDYDSSTSLSWLNNIPEALFVTEKLLGEKMHWQKQFEEASAECNNLKNQASIVSRERDRERDLIESLRQDQQTLHGRIMRLNQEQREVRNHWLGEKADLEGRMFQLQALNTQFQGTIKKRDKEIDRLQQLLAKMVKESQTKAPTQGSHTGKDKQPAAKGFSIHFVTMPLKKNLSQCSSVSVSAAAALKDSEVLAAKATIKSISAENDSLRQAVEKLQTSISQLHTQFEATLAVAEARNSHLVEQLEQQAASAATASPPSLPVQSSPVSPQSPELDEGVVRFADMHMHTPLPRSSVTEVFIDGLAATTPVARPVSWVVEQVNTQVKRLRDRAELISHMQLQSGLCPTTPGSHLKHSLHADGRMQRMQCRLTEALAVIEEQDRLIHQALLGRLEPDVNNKMGEITFHVDNIDGENSPILNAKSDNIASHVDEFDLLDLDLLPPASPATIQLLKECGWSVLPAEMTTLPQSRRRVSGNTTSLLCAKIASEKLIF